MNNFLKRLVRLLPDDVLFGQSFRYAKRLHEEFNASNDKVDFVQSYQQNKFRELFTLAPKAPFYHYIQPTSAIPDLQFIDKQIVARSFNELIVSKDGADYVTTGGTSGKPLGFFINKSRKGFEWYWMTYNWSQVGFTHNDYRAVLRNHKLDGKQFKIDPLLREYQYNNFGLNEAYLKFVVNDINSKNLRFLHAYPSAAYTLANYVYREKKNTTLQTFLCGSETVFDYQKELIQDKLNIRMFTWYGLSEKTMLAAEGKTCMHYHANPFYSYSELIDEDGHPITAPGQSGELTGTSFFNTKMPFIRYKTGDFADFVGNTCPECGHVGLTFKNVKGRRVGDKIYKSDGSYITTTALNLHDDIYYYIKGLQWILMGCTRLVTG